MDTCEKCGANANMPLAYICQRYLGLYCDDCGDMDEQICDGCSVEVWR